jgi:peptidoglycan/LPS O-acetylase OafA/YrhL
LTTGGREQDDPGVRGLIVPIVGAALAAGWIVAAAFDAPAMAALVAAAAVSASVCLAVRRRRRHRRMLVAVAVGAGLAVGALLGAELLLPHGGPTRLVLQLAFVLLLAPVVPALYAATFEPPCDGRDRSGP